MSKASSLRASAGWHRELLLRFPASAAHQLATARAEGKKSWIAAGPYD